MCHSEIALTAQNRRQCDFYNTAMVYAAEDDEELDGITAAKAKMANVLFNIVDNLQESEFITPALVDRDPVTIAIGTEGTAPILARKIKAQIEARYFYDLGPTALREGGKRGVARTLNKLFAEAQNEADDVGKVFLVGSGPGDPDLLTRKALKVLHEADVVIHDRLVAPEILELARREAELIQTGKQGFGPSWKQDDINQLMVKHAKEGAQIVRLKSGDPAVFGRLDEEMDALDAAGIDFEIIPGITTASAAAASLNVSLTKRKRNSALQIMTAQDIKGFAEQDWRKLAQDGAVAAIYMGFKSAHLLSGRLLMHGADANTSITIMENVSRVNQKTIVTSIGDLPKMAEHAGEDGPVILMLGLEPRQVAKAIENNKEKFIQAGVL